MNFAENASSKRQHYTRLSRMLKYKILKEQDTDERGKAQMKHKPYSCDMKQKEGEQMNVLNANDLYNKSEDFKEYVDKYSTKHKISVQEALTHKLVQEVGKNYKEKMISSGE